MKSLYIDTANSGISGDMLLASLLSLISDSSEIIADLKELKHYLKGVSHIELELTKVKRMGVVVNQLKLAIKESKNHRTSNALFNALERFLLEKNFSEPAKIYAKKVLSTLFEAEAAVHGDLVENIHLHELSSVDTLIDILGVTKALDKLGGFNDSFEYYYSKVPLGGGNIKTAHGILPVPAPATAKVLELSKLVVFGGPIEKELVTPTGAALLVNLNPKLVHFTNQMKILKVTYSTGQKKFKNFSNVLRLIYGENKETISTPNIHPLQKYVEDVAVLETDVDDVSGEMLGNFINTMEKEDILDIHILPSVTKKNRPSHIIKILCHPQNSFEIMHKIINELGTLGIRFYTIKRVCVDRKFEKSKIDINNKTYELNFKISYIKMNEEINVINVKPEFEDLKRISKESTLSIKEILFYCQSEIKKHFENSKKAL
jgi:uncharacterized protein (TIGR00299 family) protein